MSPHIADREKDKFVETDNGDTAIRVQNTVTDTDGDELKVNNDGSINIKTQFDTVTLFNILKELKKISLYLSIIADEEINDGDV